MIKHYEDLWNEAEILHRENQSTSLIIDEITAKFNLYKALDLNDKIKREDKVSLKTHMLGDILFTLTKLSYQDNIDVYKAMSLAIQSFKVVESK